MSQARGNRFVSRVAVRDDTHLFAGQEADLDQAQHKVLLIRIFRREDA